MDDALSYGLERAAAKVDVSARTLQNAIADGSLTAHYVGRKPLISHTDLVAWFESLPTTRRAS